MKGELTAAAFRHWQEYRRDGAVSGDVVDIPNYRPRRCRRPRARFAAQLRHRHQRRQQHRCLSRGRTRPACARAPIRLETGPTSANDTGASEVESIQSIEDTRPSSRPGTRVCISVPHATSAAEKPAPPIAAIAAICHRRWATP